MDADSVMFYSYQLLTILLVLIVWVCIFRCCLLMRQKTHEAPQQPRMYVSSVQNRSSMITSHQPIYVTPLNVPPPKYEVLAPPSYDEVVGLHYPATLTVVAVPTTTTMQPIATATQPTTSATQPTTTTIVPTTNTMPPTITNTQPTETNIQLTTTTTHPIHNLHTAVHKHHTAD